MFRLRLLLVLMVLVAVPAADLEPTGHRKSPGDCKNDGSSCPATVDVRSMQAAAKAGAFNDGRSVKALLLKSSSNLDPGC